MASPKTRITIFPLTGAILYPGLHLPLHIFEPRYRAMISDALARDRRIGMIQPQREFEGAPLFQVGCLGRIGEVEALDDGRFNIVLEGESRFRLLRELDVTTPFRQVEAEGFGDGMEARRGLGLPDGRDADMQPLPAAQEDEQVVIVEVPEAVEHGPAKPPGIAQGGR